MEKKRTVCAVLGITAGILLAGCGQQAKTAEWKANENSIFVTRDGRVQSALVYSSEQFNELYQEDELRAFAEDVVAEYNAGSGKNEGATESGTGNKAVTLKSCRLENRTGYLVFDYEKPEDYLDFAKFSEDNTNTITGLDVVEAGDGATAVVYEPEIRFVTPKGKEGNVKKTLDSGACNIVAVEGAGTVCTEGKIILMSEGTVLKDSFTAVTGEGKHYLIFR